MKNNFGTVDTIEAEYEHRIANIVKKMIRDEWSDKSTITANELMDWLELNTAKLGRLVFDDMVMWMDEEGWLKAVTK
jgi:KaiC/GvpD/RAD55 family RecA-like ATPase